MTDAYAKMLSQMMESGQEMLRSFNPALASMTEGMSGMADGMKAGGMTGAFDKLFPTMPADLMEMWFGKTFNREGLDSRTRLLVTLAGLAVQGAALPGGPAEPQMKVTIRHALESGATEREIAEVIWQMSMFGGLPAMRQALDIAQAVFDEKKEDSK
ncbi:carboxymuconolactone decarboxylase family protein [Xinfangfangia sp. D13-10-4-6]|uniref:carboxymuconolactone decarboxylase family protein n=1 Tax=Pseudogemmobacter hezensis TaxID=2737662 RepID=UPI001553F4E5|nr:carboxymuconolactone decarboxylase family protein [Pseudogemmobacter hezensis]NPD15244.1 carboxymuconolactone decarboxylase family protein [Pseudogemmobacter hezensis]